MIYNETRDNYTTIDREIDQRYVTHTHTLYLSLALFVNCTRRLIERGREGEKERERERDVCIELSLKGGDGAGLIKRHGVA